MDGYLSSHFFKVEPKMYILKEIVYKILKILEFEIFDSSLQRNFTAWQGVQTSLGVSFWKCCLSFELFFFIGCFSMIFFSLIRCWHFKIFDISHTKWTQNGAKKAPNRGFWWKITKIAKFEVVFSDFRTTYGVSFTGKKLVFGEL